MRVSYRVIYGSAKAKKQSRANRKLGAAIALAICTVCLAAVLKFTGFADKIADQLLPGDAEVTRSAFSGMVEQLRAGQTFADAVTVFCREVIDGAGLE